YIRVSMFGGRIGEAPLDFPCFSVLSWPMCALAPQTRVEPDEPLREIAPAPQAHGVTSTMHLHSDSEIGGLVGGCCPQDQPTPERQGLGRARRAYERLSLRSFLVDQLHCGSVGHWHGGDPWAGAKHNCPLDRLSMPIRPGLVQIKDWGRIYET